MKKITIKLTLIACTISILIIPSCSKKDETTPDNTPVNNPLTGSWIKKSSIFPDDISNVDGYFTIDNNLYILTRNLDENYLRLYEYNTMGASWIRKANYPESVVYNVVLFSLNGKGYVGTGFNEITKKASRKFWQYDPKTNLWTSVADFGNDANDARTDAIAFTANNKAYVGFGSLADGLHSNNKDLWEYDPIVDKWNKKSDFPLSDNFAIRGQAVRCYEKNYLRVHTSSDNLNPSTARIEFWYYDDLLDKWNKEKTIPFQDIFVLASHSFAINNKIYFVSNPNGSGRYFIKEYDIKINSFIDKKPLNADGYDDKVDIRGGGFFSTATKAYLSFGLSKYSNTTSQDTWEFTP